MATAAASRAVYGRLPPTDPINLTVCGRLPLTSRDSLTPRELDCVAQLCQGMSNNEIAATLFLEPSTVKTHLSSAMAKTGTHNRVQLVIWAFRNGVVE